MPQAEWQWAKSNEGWPRPQEGWPPGGPSGRQMRRRFGCFFFAFVASLALLVFGVLWLALGADALATQQRAAVVALLCGLPAGLFLALSFAGGWFYRRIGAPLSELMAAADAVADGDLATRVPETASGAIGRFARRFNRMVAELQTADEQRRHLTADVAHELRTPLHIIQGNLEGVLDGVYEPSPDHIAATLSETRLLVRLVDDLQTLTLAEAGQLPLHLQTVNATDLLADVQTRFAPLAAEKGIALEVVTVGAPDTLLLEVDAGRIDQVLGNLVGNALQHTPEGGRVSLSAGSAGETISLVVSDTGVGIPAEDLPYVFERFWRGDRARTRSAGAGSGLGLAIARQLTRSHGGDITVESLPGQGAAFTVDLPAAAGDNAAGLVAPGNGSW